MSNFKIRYNLKGFSYFILNRGYLSPVGHAERSNYASLGQETVHEYSTMRNRDLVSHESKYEVLVKNTVHVYSTMQNRDLN